jgi:hypothetical protein
MAINFLNNVDFNQNQLFHPTVENQPNDTAAGTPVDGQLYYNTGASPGLKVGEGGSWEYVGESDTNNYVTGGSVSSGTVTLTRLNLADVTFAINNSNITNGANYITAASLPTVNDGTLTVQGTGALGGSGTFTANDSSSPTISITHDTFGTAGTYAYPSSITTNSTGHVTGITPGSAPPTPSDVTITLTAGDELDGGGAFTLNQATGEEITFDLATGGAGAAVYGSTSDSIKIDTITLDAYGRVTDVATGATGQVNSLGTGSSGTISIGGTPTVPTVAALTAAVADGAATLATGDQIYDFVTGQIANIPSGLSFEGNWNADTDSPDLSTATPDNGQFWIVSVAGTTDLDGIDEWAVGDWAIYVSTGAGTDGWQKVDNSSTLSGFGATNQVTYWSSTGNVAGDAGFTFNPTSNALTVGGTITATGGNSTEWNTSYDNMVTAFTDSGSGTITLTLTQQDGGTLSTSFANPQGTMSSWTIKEGNGTESTDVTNGETLTIAQGSGIQSELTSTTSGGTIEITNTDRGSSQNIFKNVASSSGTAVADNNNDTLTIVGAGGISTAVSGDTLTITSSNTNSSNTYAATITDSVSGTAFNHGLGEDVIVQLYDATSKDTVYADVVRNGNYLNITFAATPSNSVRVLVQKIG